MARTIEVEVDAAGVVHARSGESIPAGHAHLTWMSPGELERWGWLKLSETSLAKDWLTPEEDEAWAEYQLDR